MDRKEYLFDDTEIKIVEEGIEAVQNLICGNEFDSDAAYRLIGLGLWICRWYKDR